MNIQMLAMLDYWRKRSDSFQRKYQREADLASHYLASLRRCEDAIGRSEHIDNAGDTLKVILRQLMGD